LKFLIINAYSWSNKGDFGIRLGMITAIRQVFGKNTEIAILSTTPQIDAIHYKGYEVNVIDWGIIDSFASSLWKNVVCGTLKSLSILSQILIYRLLRYRKSGSLIDEYVKSDLVISPGGGYLNDSFTISMLVPNLFQIWIAILLNKPFVIYSQSIGPFRSKFWSALTKITLEKAQIIQVREKISLDWLSRIKVSNPNVFLTSDAAFLLNPSTDESIEKIFLKENIPMFNLIGITPVYWSFPNHNNHKEKYWNYILSIAETVNNISFIDKNANFVFVTHVTDVRNLNGGIDKFALRDIILNIREKDRIFVIKGDYAPNDLIGIYGKMRILIGSRMHSNIFALVAGTPVIAIAYEHKTNGIMNMCGLKNWVLDIDNIDAQQLSDKVLKLLNDESTIRRQIDVNVSNIKRNCIRNAEIISDYIKQMGD
jgi:colanic acid/amylovoran biosynthesis protein